MTLKSSLSATLAFVIVKNLSLTAIEKVFYYDERVILYIKKQTLTESYRNTPFLVPVTDSKIFFSFELCSGY